MNGTDLLPGARVTVSCASDAEATVTPTAAAAQLRGDIVVTGLLGQVRVQPRGRTLYVVVLDGELDLETVEALARPYARETSYDARGVVTVPALYVDVRYAPSALCRREALVPEAA